MTDGHALRLIAAKLTAMAVAGDLFMVLVAVTVLFIARAGLAARRVEKAHARVDAVWSMAESFQHAAEAGAITEEEAKARFFAAIKEIGLSIGRISEISSTIASAVEEQGAATQEISRNVQQAAQGAMEGSSNISDVQRGAGETGSASAQVLTAAKPMSRDSNRLKLEVAKLLHAVRAA